jgi:DNA-binding NarL/FixJ family response regulator
MISVLLVDTRPPSRDGLRARLDAVPDLSVRGEAWGGREAVERARRLAVDMVLMAPAILDRLVEELSAARPGTAHVGRLTGREVEVLGYVASGMSNREIAVALSVSETTIRTHVVHLLDKLDLRNRVQAAAYAQAVGIAAAGPLLPGLWRSA